MNVLVTLARDYKNDDFRGQCYVIELFETISRHLDGLNDLLEIDDDQIAHISFLQENCSKVLFGIFNCQSFSESIFSDSCCRNIRTCIAVLKFLLDCNESSQWYLSEDLPNNILYNILFQTIHDGKKKKRFFLWILLF